MMTDLHEELIISRIEREQLSIQTLKEDLIDHFCCLVEKNMDCGAEFEQAYQQAYKTISPDGLRQIEEETTLLLNYNKLMLMKRLTFASGFIFSIVLMTGIFFKVMHFPGAMVLLAAGELGFFFIFLPLLLIVKFSGKSPISTSEKTRWILGALGTTILGVGAFFKVGHLPGAAVLLGISFLIIVLGFLPLLFLSMYRQSMERI